MLSLHRIPRQITIWMALGVFAVTSVSSEMIKGKVTDYDTQAPIAGVKVKALSSDSTLTADDGSFALTFAPAALGDKRHSRQTQGEVTYTWRNLRGAVVRDGGRLVQWRNQANRHGQYAPPGYFIAGQASKNGVPTVPDSKASSALAKSAAVHRLAFEVDGYMRAVQQINGGHDSMQVRLKKGDKPTQLAQLTWYTSYPDPNSEECVQYNGCTWAGQFAALNGKQPESWVKANNIAAVHEKDFAIYKLKTLRLTQGYRQIDVVVYDMCSDSDCNGCCTQNAKPTGFLIDIESYTAERFESGSGQVAWTCLDCD